MCNFCNTGYSCGGSGYNYGYPRTSCGCGSLWNGTTQYLCRDCNGNIRINQRNTCGCHCCGHTCGCGNNGNAGNDAGATGNANGNGGFTCVTFCGNTTNTAQPNTTAATNGEYYYARQYGLLPGCCTRTCGCGLAD